METQEQRDHNISCVNDQSQRSNFESVYELDPSGGQPSASRPDARQSADGEHHGVIGRGQGGLPRNLIAALGKEAFGFGRSQTQTPYEQDATHLGDSGMSGQRHPVRSRREVNANYWYLESARDGYYGDESMAGHGGY